MLGLMALMMGGGGKLSSAKLSAGPSQQVVVLQSAGQVERGMHVRNMPECQVCIYQYLHLACHNTKDGRRLESDAGALAWDRISSSNDSPMLAARVQAATRDPSHHHDETGTQPPPSPQLAPGCPGARNLSPPLSRIVLELPSVCLTIDISAALLGSCTSWHTVGSSKV